MNLRFRSVAAALAVGGGCHAFVATRTRPARPATQLYAEPESDPSPETTSSAEEPTASLAYLPHLEEAKAQILAEEAAALEKAARALELQARAWEEAANALEDRSTTRLRDLVELDATSLEDEQGPELVEALEDSGSGEIEIEVENYKPEEVMEANVVANSKADDDEERWRKSQPTPYGIANGGRNPFLKEEKVEQKNGGGVVEALVQERNGRPAGGARSAQGTLVQNGVKRGSSLRDLVSGKSTPVGPVATLERDGAGTGAGLREAASVEANGKSAQNSNAKVGEPDAVGVRPKSVSLREILNQMG